MQVGESRCEKDLRQANYEKTFATFLVWTKAKNAQGFYSPDVFLFRLFGRLVGLSVRAFVFRWGATFYSVFQLLYLGDTP